jgi:hypothetical protein
MNLTGSIKEIAGHDECIALRGYGCAESLVLGFLSQRRSANSSAKICENKPWQAARKGQYLANFMNDNSFFQGYYPAPFRGGL